MIQHLAIIPDGNRRWAKKHNIQTLFGHKKGIEAVQAVLDTCFKQQIGCVTFYTFSLENFQRSDQEKTYLFNLLNTELLEQLPFMMKHNIRISFMGDRSLFPDQATEIIETLEEKTALNTTLRLNLLFCYGAQQELVSGVIKIAHQIRQGNLQPEQITLETIYQSLWTADLAPPDLIIRTGNMHRLSNFLLFQAAYSEIMFLDCLWPDITEQKLTECITKFKSITRNFGT